MFIPFIAPSGMINLFFWWVIHVLSHYVQYYTIKLFLQIFYSSHILFVRTFWDKKRSTWSTNNHILVYYIPSFTNTYLTLQYFQLYFFTEMLSFLCLSEDISSITKPSFSVFVSFFMYKIYFPHRKINIFT